MAEGKLENKDLFDKNILLPAKKNAEELLKTIEMLDDAVIKMTDSVTKLNKETGKKSVVALNKQEKAFDGTNKLYKERVKLDQERRTAEEKLAKIENDRIKLLDRLNEANSDSIQTNEEIKVQLQEQSKINKRLAKDKLGLISTYEKESKRLNDLRKQYKNLVLEEGKTTKETRKLLKVIKSLDAELKDVDSQVGQNQRNVGNYTDAIKDQTKAIAGWAAGLFGAGKALDGLKSSVEGSEEGSEDMRAAMGSINAVMQVLQGSISGVVLDLIEFIGEVSKGERSIFNLEGAFQRTSKATDDLDEKLASAAKDGAELVKAEIELEKSLRPLREELTTLNAEFEKQNQISGDTTKSFKEIEEAALLAAKANEKRVAKEKQIAQSQIDILLERKRLADDSGRSTLQIENELSKARIALTDVESQALLAAADVEKTIRENNRDRFERELDFSLDVADAQKTVNERQISNENLTLKVRNKIFEDTEKVLNESFQEQIKLVQDFTKQKIDLDELSKESDEAVIRQKLKSFNFDDVTLGRILEIIKERKFALQDLTDAEKDLAAARLAQNEIDDETINKAEKRADELKQLTEASLDAVDNLITKSIDKRQDAIDDQLDASEKQQDRLRDLATRGVRDAQGSLAEEQKKEAELLREQEKQEKRKAQLEFVTSGLNLFSQKVENDDPNALGSTIAQMTLLTQTLKNLPLFYEGTEKVSDSLSPTFNTGKDDYAIRVDGSERIMNPTHSAMVDGISNAELADLGYKYKTGSLNTNEKSNIVHAYASNQMVVSAVNEVARKLDELELPKTSLEINELHKVVEYITKRGNKVEMKTKKLRA